MHFISDILSHILQKWLLGPVVNGRWEYVIVSSQNRIFHTATLILGF